MDLRTALLSLSVRPSGACAIYIYIYFFFSVYTSMYIYLCISIYIWWLPIAYTMAHVEFLIR